MPNTTIKKFDPDAANPYMPYVSTVLEVVQETHNIKSFRVRPDDEEVWGNFRFAPGQLGQLSVFGVGEATFVINSPPSRMEYLQFTVIAAGEVTAALHGLEAGDKVGVRAPLGNWFPYNDYKGKNIVFIGGGIGMAPMRTLLLYMLDNREDFGDITLLYGARTPQDLSFSYDLRDWMSRKDMHTVLTVDTPADGWEHSVGLIPNVLTEMAPSPEKTIAITCGPPIMIKYTIQALEKLGFKGDQIVTTLEKRMKCGIGICGRCNIGEKYVCIDGPVFTSAQLGGMVNEL